MEERASLLPRISVARPVTVTMCLLALLVVGAVAYLGIRVEMMPSGYTHPYMHVRIRYPNATPQEVEQQITRPLEERLRTIKGIESVRTYTGSWGVSAPLRFQQDADMTLAYNQLMDQIERLKLELPDEARDLVSVWKHNDDDNPIMWIGMLQKRPVTDPHRFLVTHVQRPLERIDGVAKVELWGADKKEVMIEVDRERLQARGVNTYEVAQTLMADNFALAGGHVREAGKKFYVRSLARYRSLEEIRNIPVSRRNGGVRLREVADVVYDVPERTWRQRINRMPASSLGIKAESRADIVKVCDRVVKALREIEKNPATSNLEFNVFFDQGRFIRESIDNLQNTGMWGGLFAACVLLFFLRALRMTAIITLAIPLCVMITVTTLYFTGWSLNLMTMMGMMVGVGMVVDNAIVILENIYRMREKGQQPREASVSGSSEVALAITMATMTTVVVFLPLILMSGNVAMTFYLFRMGMPVMAMLIGSLFVALLFIPLAAMRFGGAKVQQDPRSIGWARSRYARALAWTLRRRGDALLIALVLFATVVFPSANLKRSDSKGGNINDVDINVRGPRYFSLADTEKLMDEIEDFLEGKREAYGIRTIRTWYSEGRGGIQVFLKSSTNEAWWYVAYRDLRSKLGFPVGHQMARKEVIQDLKKQMPKFVGVWIGVESWGGGGGGNPSVGVCLYGEDTEVLAELIDEVDRRLRTIPSVISVDTDLEQAQDEVQVRIDRDRAHAVGVSPRVLGRTLAFSLQGVPLPKYQAQKREVDTRLYLQKADRQTLHQLKNLTFRSRSGEEIPLSELAGVRMARGRSTIRREDGKTRLMVRAFTTKDDLKGLYAEIDRVMDGFQMPRGYYWDKGERYARFREDDETRMFAVLMAVTCVFLLMGVLFESFILPFSVLFSIPFAFLGVYWTLYLTGTPMEIMATIGIIVLIGLVVNNAIVLVDMINRLRVQGMDRLDAILEAGHNRFRPIMMTTFTTVFGLLPMSVGNTSLVGIPYAPLGRTMMGGLICSTLLTLFVVPLFYTYLDDLRNILRRIAGSAMQSLRPEAPDTVAAQGDD